MFIGFLFLFLCLFIYMWWEAHRNRVVEVELSFVNFPSSFHAFTIFFISDLHRRTLSDTIVRRVKGKADIVLIGGDLTEKGVPFARVRKNIRQLKAIGPIYFVWGNNDHEVSEYELEKLLLEEGVHILDNRAVIWTSGEGEKIALLGVDDISKRRDRLDAALLHASEGSFRILASHNPEIVRKIRPEHHISLVLSGHTHGGQIRFFTFGLYEKGGMKQVNGTTVYVSNGYGTTNVPLRLGAPAETNLITIRRWEENDVNR
ncbi:metallophosphoesterase [Thermaerobacillus caldiproteolyticus]|uniref:Putative MPP superfamily phosphohydrolase n=1 Tax=Thermaerobacillus caldiproteolyticus TaxID=247480 RepID=A0A7V9Z6U2_9BACL|nr:metallophosphoesterase [Anoxybacillus caldiproteolyticus]MBA2874995.1 putative MPP superfamily phosphohydrolase [Anoxybacillus caldiproteolyticus]QPA33019.1 metallophosphoesterase [Anoxybacillus caldiproteolyticus]